jgi:hypothetical protein
LSLVDVRSGRGSTRGISILVSGAPSGGGDLGNDGLGEAVGGVMGGEGSDGALRAGGTGGGSNDAMGTFDADGRLGVGTLGTRGRWRRCPAHGRRQRCTGHTAVASRRRRRHLHGRR